MDLKSAKTVGDVATLLGFKASALSFILYYKPDATKYTQFVISKKSGGTRTINAPSSDLKLVQKKLSVILQDCIEEIAEIKGLKDKASHGFRRDHDIVSNAKEHKNRKYVFNVDIADFFGSINFGRVYGYFMKDQNFALDRRVAAVLARIACHEDALPQGAKSHKINQ